MYYSSRVKKNLYSVVYDIMTYLKLLHQINPILLACYYLRDILPLRCFNIVIVSYFSVGYRWNKVDTGFIHGEFLKGVEIISFESVNRFYNSI